MKDMNRLFSNEMELPIYPDIELSSGLHRMMLNNWLQVHGGVTRLSYDVAGTGPQHDITWTASALSKTRLHHQFTAEVTISIVDGTRYATGTGRTQGYAKEMAARLTRQRLEDERT
jgi:hypothetical protein